jgi:prepilin-type processing-associated H-X9-DG protein
MGVQSQLIKWLAALASILVLAAILFPVFATSHRSGPRLTCLSRVKQITLGHMIYASDHDDRLTLASTWEDGVEPYVKQRFSCPEAPGKRYGYAMLDNLSAAKLTAMKKPAAVPLTIESAACIPNAHGDERLIPNPGRHGGSNTVGYADGHAKSVRVPR